MITASRHPLYSLTYPDWEQWRLTYAADDSFLIKYLEKFSNREDQTDFELRRKLTPVPGFAAAAVDEIKNSIFQRLVDVVRTGGSVAYQKAVAGEGLGVDRRGSSMNAFLGQHVISDLLVMQRVGIYVDNSISSGPFAANQPGTPYLYHYPTENILNWVEASPDQPSEFQSLLLQDQVMTYDSVTRLPLQAATRFRLVWIGPDGRVNVRIMDEQDNDLEEPRVLDLDRIPFVMIDLGDSLIRRVARHQIALMNLASSDVSYALRSNFPFYVEQKDLRAAGSHLKQAATDGTANAGEGAADANIKVGVSQGRAYDVKMDKPGFIHPSPEPLKASMELQAQMKQDIRQLVNLAVTKLGQQSADSKEKDNEGLAAGLSFIGLMLQSAESKVAEHWAAYESRSASSRTVATVKYPDRYTLKTDADRIEEADKLGKLLYSVPGRKAKQEIAKQIVRTLLGGKVNVGVIQSIEKEIDESDYLTSDPKTIVEAVKAGLCGEKTGSMALGFNATEYLRAREDHAERVKRILESQGGPNGGTNGASRGAPDLSGAPATEASAEKEASRNTDTKDTTQDRVRGEGDE